MKTHCAFILCIEFTMFFSSYVSLDLDFANYQHPFSSRINPHDWFLFFGRFTALYIFYYYLFVRKKGISFTNLLQKLPICLRISHWILNRRHWKSPTQQRRWEMGNMQYFATLFFIFTFLTVVNILITHNSPCRLLSTQPTQWMVKPNL